MGKQQLNVEQRHPYRAEGVRLWVDGKFMDKGHVTVALAGAVAGFTVGCAEFAVLAILIRAAKTPTPDWLPRGFLTTNELSLELLKQIPDVVDTRRIARYIHNIRNALKQVAIEEFGVEDGRAWAFNVLETDSRGYRISIPTRHLRLEVKETRVNTGHLPDRDVV